MSLELKRITDPIGADMEAFKTLLAKVRETGGFDVFDDQARLEASTLQRASYLLLAATQLVGVATHSDRELDLVVAPSSRGKGFGAAALKALLPRFETAKLTAWSHGNHPAAAILAKRYGFEETRTLYRLRLDRLDAVANADLADDISVRSFEPGSDDEAWVALNAKVFASHPEQGALTLEDLQARMSQDWFDTEKFLVAESNGTLIGYCWMKQEPGATDGELYVLGVAQEYAGQGLGRALTNRGLASIRRAGATSSLLYVDGDNPGALHLYRSMGYADDKVDVQYTKSASREL